MNNKQTTARYSPESAGGFRPAESGRSVRADSRSGSPPPGFQAGAGAGGGGEPPASIWARVRSELKRKLGETAFRNWIARLELVGEVDDDILIAAPSELDRDRVQRDYMRDIQLVWSENDRSGRAVTVEARNRISVDVLALAGAAADLDETEGDDEAVAAAAEIETGGEVAPTPAADGLTLDNFLVGESNRGALTMARRLGQGVSVAANVVTIFGPNGVGKSHLLRGIEAERAANTGAASVVYMSAEEFMLAFVDGIRQNDMSRLHERIRAASLVLLDDLQFIAGKKGTLKEFFQHMRAVTAKGGVVVMTMDSQPSQLDLPDARMLDEIQGGAMAFVDLPDRALRSQIVRAKAEEIQATDPGFVLAPEWIELIAERLPTSGRVLCGVVRTVYVNTVLADEPLDLAAVEKAIQLSNGSSSQRPPRIDTIKDVTARTYGITKADLDSQSRRRVFSRPRQFAMYLSRKLTTASYPMIGRMFGDRDHTTILFAFRKVAKMMKEDPRIAEEVRQLEQRVLLEARNARPPSA